MVMATLLLTLQTLLTATCHQWSFCLSRSRDSLVFQVRYLQRGKELYLSCFSWTLRVYPSSDRGAISSPTVSCSHQFDIHTRSSQSAGNKFLALWHRSNLLLCPFVPLLPFNHKLPFWNMRFLELGTFDYCPKLLVHQECCRQILIGMWSWPVR